MLDKMTKDIDGLNIAVFRDIESELRTNLDRCGLFYKIFSRVKKGNSAKKKIEDRFQKGKNEYKIQDVIGFRIVLYFKEDIELCEKIIQNKFKVENVSKDEEETTKFKPTRINYVCRMNQRDRDKLGRLLDDYPIDSTFEIQIRTVFSEGWHEIEHDFRYKCIEDWESNDDLARTLNGVLATLENCDWTISRLFEELAYRHYKNKEWMPMMKNKMKIRMQEEISDNRVLTIFDENPELAKQFFRAEREELMLQLIDMMVPLNFNNLIYILNETQIKNESISVITPDAMKNMIKNK